MVYWNSQTNCMLILIQIWTIIIVSVIALLVFQVKLWRQKSSFLAILSHSFLGKHLFLLYTRLVSEWHCKQSKEWLEIDRYFTSHFVHCIKHHCLCVDMYLFCIFVKSCTFVWLSWSILKYVIKQISDKMDLLLIWVKIVCCGICKLIEFRVKNLLCFQTLMK